MQGAVPESAGRRLLAGRYRLEREVGRGAVGIVFAAHDELSGRPVALKLLAEAGVDQTERERLLREGRILSDLEDEGIVGVEGFGSLEEPFVDEGGLRLDPGTPYVAMEWLAGEDLSARSKRAPLTLGESLSVARQVARTLAATHAAGVVHRDIKPSNVFVVDEPGSPLRIKLVDFGVATTGDAHLRAEPTPMVGTPDYMAPEQARGDGGAEVRSDIYSLGATLFELLVGHPPHTGPNAVATLARVATTPAPRLSDLVDDVPAALDDLCAAMLATSPDDRPSSMADVVHELDALIANPDLPGARRLSAHAVSSGGKGATRLVTTVVALSVATGPVRRALLEEIGQQGAAALPLGTDAIVAHLGAKRAFGDEAARALAIGERLSALGGRVGIATGRAKVDQLRSAGEIVDRAAQLARQSSGGQLVADPTTFELAGERVALDDAPSSERLSLATAIRRRPAQVTSFVGRETELRAVLEAYDRAVEDQSPVIVSVSGPPGIGKSRLVREVLSTLESREPCPRRAIVHTESYARAQALGVAAHVLRALLSLSPSATVEQARTALETQRVDDALLALLLAGQPFPNGTDPQAARDALYLSMTDVVLRVVSAGPTVLVIEDAQWSDPESIAWLEHLLGRATGRPLFGLALMRPGFWREQPQRFSGRDHVRIDLRPISLRATREIAREVIGPMATDAQLDQVAQQAAGSPLFADALARLVAAGKDPLGAATIEAAIQVTLDALDETARRAVVCASIFGQRFWDRGLSALGIEEPQAALKRLLAAELLTLEDSSRFEGARQLVFRHALVRDVAYASAGEEQRRTLHARAAHWLAELGEEAATVAQHFDLGQLHKEASSHWESAARRALAVSSLADAATMADRALSFAEDPQTGFARACLLEEAYARLDARASDRGEAIAAMREHAYDDASQLLTEGASARYDDARGTGFDVETRLSSVRDRARELGLVSEAARCAATLAQRYAFRGELSEADRAARELLELSEDRGIVSAAVDAWQTVAVVRQTRGELAAALDARRSAAKAARAAGLGEREAMLTINLGFALTTIGARNEALVELEQGIAKAQSIGSPGAVRHGQMNLLGWAATYGGEPRLDPMLAECRATADEAATGGWIQPDRSTLGILFYRGVELLRADAQQLARARGLLRTAAESYRQTGNLDILPVALGAWAEAERRLGDAELASSLAREAAHLLEQGAPSLLNEASIFLALHDAAVDSGDLNAARDAIVRGLPFLERRLSGLKGTAYESAFLTNLAPNATLLSTAETYGLDSPVGG